MNVTTSAKPRRKANPQGNERLTAMTGTVLLVLFTAECLTTCCWTAATAAPTSAISRSLRWSRG